MKNDNKQEIFVVISMQRFGDNLVVNSLFQNIKRLYPKSKTVYIVNKPYYEAAKYQKDVDETIIFDKDAQHKGILGMLKFVRQFPYKNIKCIFKTYKKERADIIAFLLHPEKIITGNFNIPLEGTIHQKISRLLKKITNEEIIDLPIKYYADYKIDEKFKDIFKNNKKYIALCPISSNIRKNMPFETAFELIKKLKENEYEVIFLGKGQEAQNFAFQLKEANSQFIDLIDKTTIYEMAQILRNCEGLISVDTGTMHFGYANDVPVVCLFYASENKNDWAPSEKIYPHTILPKENTVECIYNSLLEVLEKTKLLKKS